MSYNWCDADEAVFAVYYLDNGSSRWDVFQNVGSNSPLPWCYFMTGGGGPSGKASNSSVSKLWCQDTSPGRNDCADLGCTVDDSSVLCVHMLHPLHALCTMCSFSFSRWLQLSESLRSSPRPCSIHHQFERLPNALLSQCLETLLFKSTALTP
jgi:hypothetical protein